MPEVSIILPTRDRPDLVGRALRSALAQTFRDIEVLLIDGNRRNPPVQENRLLASLLTDLRVRIIDGRSAHNAAGARNAGLAQAQGAWITFLDDDDAYRADKISAQHELARQTGVDCVLCGYELIWPHLQRPRQIDQACFMGDEILTHTSLASCALFHRSTPSVRFHTNLSAGEDMLYGLQVILKHGIEKLPCVPKPLVEVYQKVDGQSVHANKEQVWRAYRTTSWAARGRFSRGARRSFLARGQIDRSLGGHGGAAFFIQSATAVIRSSLPRKWRLVAYAFLARLRH